MRIAVVRHGHAVPKKEWSAGHRFGVIVSETSADIKEASSFIATCDDLDWANEMAERICSDGEQWAVVDLITMGLAARGTHDPGSWLWHPAVGRARRLLQRRDQRSDAGG